jgi:hypothetical protein
MSMTRSPVGWRLWVLPEAFMLLTAVLLMVGCAPLKPPSGRGRNLGYTPQGEVEAVPAEKPSSRPEPRQPQRLHRRREFRKKVTSVRPRSAAELEGQSASLTREAVLNAVTEASGTVGVIAGALPGLARKPGRLGDRVNGIFTRYIDYGSGQVPWIHGALGDVRMLVGVASEVEDADMQLALLRLSGPRLQAATSGGVLLAAWLDFLNLAEAVVQKCPAYSVERLFRDMERVQKRIEPTMKALASLEPSQVEAATAALPELMGELTQEFQSLREAARVAMEGAVQIIEAVQFLEMLTMMSTLRLALPRVPPTAPALTGVGLVMGSGGVMAGSRIVVTAEWVEMMRRLVQAGVISVSAASAAVRIHAGQVMMAQANRELPQGVRDALGEGPEVRGMHETGKAGAGMAERPRHHVLADEFREWFEKRGFTGAMNIDKFCVELEMTKHQAIHGGGNWRLGRTWPGEWNQLIMRTLRDAETSAGRMLTRNEILDIVAERMKEYRIPMNFVSGRKR